jgi:oxalate decarboxylase/phosphoglucose isomerase-like protein (cupin superfamily)
VKWYVTPSNTEGATITFGEGMLMPGRDHERHNHPDAEELIYILSGKGEMTLGDESFSVSDGDTVHIPKGAFHSVRNSGWMPLRILAVYSPGGPEEAWRDSPNFRAVPGGQAPPTWSLDRA